MGMRRSPSPASWAEVCEAVDVSALAPSSRASPILQSRSSGSASSAVDTLKDKARIEQELESDRRFFADPPDDYVRCPVCHVVYAVHSSRPSTPTDVTTVACMNSAPPVLIP